MTIKLQATLTTPAASVKIKYDDDTSEYVVHLVGAPDADYSTDVTDSVTDAIGTALYMLKHKAGDPLTYEVAPHALRAFKHITLERLQDRTF